MSRRSARFLAALPLVGSGWIALAGLLIGGLQCDYSCTGEGWQHTAGAPQWTLLTVAGFLVLVTGIAHFVFVYRARPWSALAALALGTGTTVAALSYWGTNWHDESGRHPVGYGAFACVVLSGVLGAFLCAPANPKGWGQTPPGSDPTEAGA